MMCRLVAALVLLFGMAPALALTLAEPDPISIGFEAGRSRLTREGLVAVDSLALRVAQCSAGRLSIQLHHAAALPAELAAARLNSVRHRLWQLGLQPTYVLMPSKRAARDPAFIRATVDSDQGVWCGGSKPRHLAVWADAMGRYVEQPALGAPVFWRRLTPEGRRELALPLAAEAYCLQGEACDRGRAAFHWLVAQIAGREPPSRRRDWLLTIWQIGADEDVVRLEQALGVAALSVDERAHAANELIASPLPWAVIERRLLAPQLMKAYADLLQGERLVFAAVERGELDALSRLLDAAGPARACLVDRAFVYVGATEERFQAWLPHVSNWLRGVDPHYMPAWIPATCDPLATVLENAYCSNWPKEEAARFEKLWQWLSSSGVVTESPGVKAMTAPGETSSGSHCRLAPEPGDPSRFRPIPQR
jgi:hypothetical protein